MLLLIQVLNLEPQDSGANSEVATTWRVVVTDRFKLEQMLAAVQKFSCRKKVKRDGLLHYYLV